MHEFELGVWKGTFQYLMRLLEKDVPRVVAEFNSQRVSYWAGEVTRGRTDGQHPLVCRGHGR